MQWVGKYMSRLMQKKEIPKSVLHNQRPNRNRILWIFDFTMYIVIATFVLLFNGDSTQSIAIRMLSLLILMSFVFMSRWVFNVYRQVWRYATGQEYLAVVWADFIGGLAYLLFSFLLIQWNLQIMVWQTITIVCGQLPCIAVVPLCVPMLSQCNEKKLIQRNIGQ